MNKRIFSIVMLMFFLYTMPIAYGDNSVGLDNFTPIRTFNYSQFKDIKVESYGAEAIKAIYEVGVLNGKDASTIAPSGYLTRAEAIALASKMHKIYYGKKVEFSTGQVNWYDSYVKYAEESGILLKNEFVDFDKEVSKAEMVYLLSNTLPSREFQAINHFKTIKDVDITDKYSSNIFRFYNAGIVSTENLDGGFRPNDFISRAEASKMMAKMINPEKRVAVNPNMIKTIQMDDANAAIAYMENEINLSSPIYYYIGEDLVRAYMSIGDREGAIRSAVYWIEYNGWDLKSAREEHEEILEAEAKGTSLNKGVFGGYEVYLLAKEGELNKPFTFEGIDTAIGYFSMGYRVDKNSSYYKLLTRANSALSMTSNGHYYVSLLKKENDMIKAENDRKIQDVEFKVVTKPIEGNGVAGTPFVFSDEALVVISYGDTKKFMQNNEGRIDYNLGYADMPIEGLTFNESFNGYEFKTNRTCEIVVKVYDEYLNEEDRNKWESLSIKILNEPQSEVPQINEKLPNNLVMFEDFNLEMEVSNALYAQDIDYENEDGSMIIEDIERVKELVFFSGNQYTSISKLEGIQKFINLENLKISGHRISDISKIAELERLVELDLSYNMITDIEPLRNLKELSVLNLSNNEISDYSVLKGLNKLKKLELDGDGDYDDFELIRAR